MGSDRYRFITIGFNVGLLLKGLFAMAEIIGGIASVLLSPERVNTLISLITNAELAEDPGDILMLYLVTYGHSYSIGTQTFLIAYLLAHGSVKLLMIILLWKKIMWSYPFAVVCFSGFIIYQIYHFVNSHSWFLIPLTILDAVMVALIILEYKRNRPGRLST